MKTRSRVAGASVLLTAAVLLIVATLCEVPYLRGAATPEGPLFWAYVVTFALAALGFLSAGLILSVGPRAALSRSALASVGFAGFGVLWVVAQALYLIGAYFAPSAGMLAVSTVFSIVGLFFGLAAGIAIAAGRILDGIARWAFVGGVILSAVTGAIAGASESAATITVLHVVSAVGLALVALTYLGAREGVVAREGAAVRAR